MNAGSGMNRKASVVGSGPNGLVAAIRLAEAGYEVTVYERSSTPGGGTRTAELTLPGRRHDVCSAMHPFGVISPAFAGLDVEWVHPEVPLVHPLDGGRAGVLRRDPGETAEAVGDKRWDRLFSRFTRNAEAITSDLLGPLRVPRHPVATGPFGVLSLPGASITQRLFSTDESRSLFIGCAAHSMLNLSTPTTSGLGLMLAMLGHAVGWPVARGGSDAIASALVAKLESLGGKVVCDAEVTDTRELEGLVMLDITPRQVLSVGDAELDSGYKSSLRRFRYGPGVFKIDYALTEPVAWTNDFARRAGTLHVGGSAAEVIDYEARVSRGEVSDKPFVLVSQASVFDSSRGGHTLWTYCHVPRGFDGDMTDAIENQIERFAPGFRDIVEARHVMSPADMEAYNPNYVGGDINGGAQDLRQFFFRPTVSLRPYRTSNPRIFICSSSTPPGGGVHGMCGWWAVETALKGRTRP